MYLIFLAMSINANLDLSAFDAQPIKAATVVDLSAFDQPMDLSAFDAPVPVDLSAFDADPKPAVKPSPAALDYPKRSSNWTHPGTDKTGIIEHLLRHPNHAGKFGPEMLQSLDYRELESLHSDDHEGDVKPVQVASVKYIPPAAVNCPNGTCPVRVSHSLTSASTGMKPVTATPQPVLYYYPQSGCPGGVCPTPQRRGIFSLIRGR